jgi:hypothetical protein
MPSVKKYGATWRYTLELEPGPDGQRRQSQKSGFRTKADALAALEKAHATDKGSKRCHSRHRPPVTRTSSTDRCSRISPPFGQTGLPRAA